MRFKWIYLLLFLLCAKTAEASHHTSEKSMTLEEVRSLISRNRSVILENFNTQIAEDNLKDRRTNRLPDINIGGKGFMANERPLTSGARASNDLFYDFNITSQFDIYTGGKHTYAIERMKKERMHSQEKLDAVRQEVELRAYILLYDIHRNIKYREFLRSSIHLREKEYERINQLYLNGLVLKSDVLRSKLYITNLQKDEVTITNSIDILSDKLCILLGMEERYSIIPKLNDDLSHKIDSPFESLYQEALLSSPSLKMYRTNQQKEETILKEIKAKRHPDVKLFAGYGIGSPIPVCDYNHQTGGQVGAKVSLSLSSLYKTRHEHKAQKRRIDRERMVYNDETDKLRTLLYEMYTRYHESLLNIDRAIEKIDMSKESNRILTNSYFNQQALLIDVLESETQLMESSFEWVQAVVDSQKYYWTLKQLCGLL